MLGHHLQRRRKGFTLIELLIVVAIIGILAAIAIPNLLSAQKRSKNATAMSDTRNIVAQAHVFILDNNNVPGAVTYTALYDGTAPGGTRFMARATDPFNTGNDYSFTTSGITGEIRSWSIGMAGMGAIYKAQGTVGHSSIEGEYNSN